MESTRLIKTAALCFVLAVSAGACDDTMDRPVAVQDPEATTGGGAEQQAEGATFTPLEVTNILLVLNQGEVEQAQLAVANATNDEVRAFAETMAAEHGQAVTRLTALQQRLGGSAADPTSSMLQREGKLITQDLAAQRGAVFDLAYMTAQISAHSKVIGMVDVSLRPSAAASIDVTSELVSLRAFVLTHDLRALQLQNVLRRTVVPN